MFEFLKKKINNFTSKIGKKEEQKEQPEEKKETAISLKEEKTGLPEKKEKKETGLLKEPVVKGTKEVELETVKEVETGELKEKSKSENEDWEEKKIRKTEEETEELGAQEVGEEKNEQEIVEKLEPQKIIDEAEEKKAIAKSAEELDKRELKAKMSVSGKLLGFVTGKVKLKEKELEELIWEFELSLLEADVEQETAEKICSKLKEEMVGKEIPKKEIDKFVKENIKKALEKALESSKYNLLEEIGSKKEKPFKILFLGPNGAGKTTTIAKITKLLQGNGKQVLLAAADTFRAASIEQLETHAEKLGVRVIKHDYGADPAAVAFDAVESAKSKGIDVVLIDTAGRQHTNKNLLEELKKIERVVKPDAKIFIGEALSGQSLIEQAKKFDEELGLDGFILTKIDTDAKGGTLISLVSKIGKPVIYVGTGQEYTDLEEFSPEFIIGRVV